MKHVKRLLSLVLATVLVLGMLPVRQVYAAQDAAGFVYSVSDKEATITGYKGTETELTIPEEVDGYTVVAIGPEAFSGNKSLTEVHFPDTLEHIYRQAFRNCDSLTEVTIPEGVWAIDGWAFGACDNLESVNLPTTWNTVYYADQYQSGWVGTGTTVFESPFAGCPKLTKIELPDGMTLVPSNAFNKVTALEELILPDSILEMGYRSLENCTSLTEIQLPPALTTIWGRVFNGCTALKEIEFPDTLEVIERCAFQNCDTLTEVTIPEGVTIIGGRAFHSCDNLESVTLPTTWEEVTYYDESTSGLSAGTKYYDGPFNECPKLTTITLPEGMTALPKMAFLGMTNLEKVVFPESLLIIYDQAFQGCTNLTDAVLPPNLTEIRESVFGGCEALPEPVFPDSLEYIDAYAFSGCDSFEELILPDSITTIGYAAFSGCESLRYVKVPASWDTVPTYIISPGTTNGSPFINCPSLTEVELPEGMTVIPNYAFKGTKAIKTITIPESVKEIHAYAFANSAMTEIDLPETLTDIGTNVFSGCTSLTKIVWPSTAPFVKGSAFSGCTALTDVTLPEGVRAIHNYAFYGCTALTEVALPESTIYLGDAAFMECTNLEKMELPKGITKLAYQLFYNCDSLTEIHLSDTVTSIGEQAFYDCGALETVTMANSVTSLGRSAFWGCKSLKDVQLSMNLTSIPNYCFKECKALEEIVIPYYATSIGYEAFNGSSKLAKVVTYPNLTSISTDAFSYRNKTILYGEAGSYTETWASDNRYTFQENTTQATSIAFANTEVEILKEHEFRPQLTIEPLGFAGTIRFTSKNPKVAQVNEDGTITGLTAGSTTIYAELGELTAECTVTVCQPVTEITLSPDDVQLLEGATCQLTATVSPDKAHNKALTWTSSDESVATVDENGLVTAVSVGQVAITATAQDGSEVSGSCVVNVVDKLYVQVVTLDQRSLILDDMETCQLTATVGPEDAEDKSLVWTSSDEEVATVDENGLVTAVSRGQATITATAADGSGVSATCSVEVWRNVYYVTDPEELESPHNYDNDCSDFWVYQVEGAESLTLTFDEQCMLEQGYDWLNIYRVEDGEFVEHGFGSGPAFSGLTLEVPGDCVGLELDTDGSTTEWGFKVTSVEAKFHTTHTYESVVTDPTCTTQGFTTYTCSYCGDSYVDDYVNALGHSIKNLKCTRCGAACENPFTDVVEGKYYYNPVIWAYYNNITKGTSATIFGVGSTCTREQVVTFLWSAAGRPEPKTTVNPFTDVVAGKYYYKAVLWAVENGITKGSTATTFGVGQGCTRGQVVTFLWSYAGRPAPVNTQHSFTDIVSGKYYYNAVLWAVERGVTSGTTATTFEPDKTCTREQIVTFLHRYNEKVLTGSDVRVPASVKIVKHEKWQEAEEADLSTLPAYTDLTTLDNVNAVLSVCDPDGYLMAQWDEEEFLAWLNMTADVETSIHETYHGFCDSAGWLKYCYYLDEGNCVHANKTTAYSTEEMAAHIPKDLQTFRYETYVAPGCGNMDSNINGVYGLMNEWNAYWMGMNYSVSMFDYYCAQEQSFDVWAEYVNGCENNRQAYAEFRYYILSYLLYAQENYPKVYEGMMGNETLRYAFTKLDKLYIQSIATYEADLQRLANGEIPGTATIRVDDDYFWYGNRGTGRYTEEYSKLMEAMEASEYQEMLTTFYIQ